MRRVHDAARTETWAGSLGLAALQRFGLGFQMHARFLLIARIRDHYTWIPKINMAVAVP